MARALQFHDTLGGDERTSGLGDAANPVSLADVRHKLSCGLYGAAGEYVEDVDRILSAIGRLFDRI
jgi:hypothetical protein